MKRNWYVYGTPIVGYIPTEATVDRMTGNANKVINGPFVDVRTAANFVVDKRPMQTWRSVAIYSKREFVK